MASKRTWSEYYINELEDSDKSAYEKKLTLNYGFLLPDPYSLDASQWSSEESFLPDIRFTSSRPHLSLPSNKKHKCWRRCS